VLDKIEMHQPIKTGTKSNLLQTSGIEANNRDRTSQSGIAAYVNDVVTITHSPVNY